MENWTEEFKYGYGDGYGYGDCDAGYKACKENRTFYIIDKKGV